jgi:hypothetical protein
VRKALGQTVNDPARGLRYNCADPRPSTPIPPAQPVSVRGELSAHYTKRPTHPNAVGRIAETMSGLKYIYVMRHPVDRLVSQYVHERTVGLDVAGN